MSAPPFNAPPTNAPPMNAPQPAPAPMRPMVNPLPAPAPAPIVAPFGAQFDGQFDGPLAHPGGQASSLSPEEQEERERQMVLRRLTPEERAQRRFRRNVIMACMGIAILMITLAVLLRLG